MANLEIGPAQRDIRKVEPILEFREIRVPFHLPLHDAQVEIAAPIQNFAYLLDARKRELEKA